MSPRPGFVLEVDRSTPQTLFWRGEGFGLERLPAGSRVLYGPEPLAALRDPDAAIRHALDHPLGVGTELAAHRHHVEAEAQPGERGTERFGW